MRFSALARALANVNGYAVYRIAKKINVVAFVPVHGFEIDALGH